MQLVGYYQATDRPEDERVLVPTGEKVASTLRKDGFDAAFALVVRLNTGRWIIRNTGMSFSIPVPLLTFNAYLPLQLDATSDNISLVVGPSSASKLLKSLIQINISQPYLPSTPSSSKSSWARQQPIPSSSQFKLESSSTSALALKLVREDLLQLDDFDDHLEDVTLDWPRNQGVTYAIENSA